MAFNIAVAGKGGTGKTTLCSLIIRQLVKNGKKPILAVDADANANLNEALGIEIEGTISDIMNRISNNVDPLPAGMTKDQYIKYRIHQSLSEGDNYDLLVMGGPEGAGCYCYANNLLRGFVADLGENYPYTIMDNEAGLEHLSRRTTQDIDVLFITSDASARGIRSAGRARELVEGLKLDVKKMYLVVSRVKDGSVESLNDEIVKTGLELIGTIPADEHVMEYDLVGKPLIDLPDDALAVAAVNDILKKAAII